MVIRLAVLALVLALLLLGQPLVVGAAQPVVGRDGWWLQPTSRPPAPGAVPPELVYLWDRYAERGDRRLLAVRADTGDATPVLDQPWPGMFQDRTTFAPDGARLYVNRNRLVGGRWVSTVDELDGGRPGLAPRALFRAELADGGFGETGGPGAWAAPVPAPDGRTLYLLRQERIGERTWRDAVEVLDLADGSRRASAPLGEVEAHGDWLRGQTTADGRLLHVHRTRIVQGSVAGSGLAVVDGADRRLVSDRSWRVGTGRWDRWAGIWDDAAGPAWCFGFYVAPDGREAYCPTWRAERFGLEVLAAPTWDPVAFVPLPNQPPREQGPGETHALYTPDGGFLLYVAGWGADRAAVAVDLAARRVTGSASLGRRRERSAGLLDRLASALVRSAEAKDVLPAPAVLSPDGRTLYAARQRVGEPTTDPSGMTRTEHGDGIAALRVADLAPHLELMAGHELWGDLAVSPDGRRLYATNRDAATLYVLDTTTGVELARWTGFARQIEGVERAVAAGGG